MNKTPLVKKGGTDVAKLAVGIGAGVAGIILPGASLFGTLFNFAVDKYVRVPEALLLQELKKGNLEILDDEKAATFIPMAYKFFEAAKEGEYEHNLQILAEFLVNELKQEEPDPSAFKRMARRIEGLSKKELKVIALISVTDSTITRISTDAPAQSTRNFISASQLVNHPNNRGGLDHLYLQEAFNELASRGLLLVDGASRFGKSEEYYVASSNFVELIAKAKEAIDEASSE
jgi:hypothetical protein